MSEDNDGRDEGGLRPPRRGPRRRPRRGARRSPGGSSAAATPAALAARRVRRVWVVLGVLVLLGFLALVGSGIYTDALWFGSLGRGNVFAVEWRTKALLALVGFLLGAVPVAASMRLAYQRRPFLVPGPDEQAMERYRTLLEPHRRRAFVLVPIGAGLMIAGGSVALWQSFLMWQHATPFGQVDPYFHRDLGFFVFELPWWRDALTVISGAVVLTFAAAAFTHYLYGGIVLPGGQRASTRMARVHLCALIAAFLVVRAISTWLEQFSLSTSVGTRSTGIRYVHEHATIPSLNILAIAYVISAALFLGAGWMRSWRIPLAAVAALVVVTVGLGSIFPGVVQAIQVQPSENQLEKPYLDRHIAATRAAYGIADVANVGTPADDKGAKPATVPTTSQASGIPALLPGLRVMDPNVISPTVKQGQGDKVYYDFPDTLDVDRYRVTGADGKASTQDVVVAAREMNVTALPASQRNWLNTHTTYTHGYGLVIAKGNTRDSEGKPEYLLQGYGDTWQGKPYEPRIYFGELSPDYSIVGGPRGAAPREFDHPDAPSGTTYAGGAGVSLGGINRLAYALKYREPNFLLSDAVTGDSRILENRTPRERVEKIAPWLTVDGNTYPAIIDGRIQWIVDGYTTSDSYPNSQLQSLAGATTDSVTDTSSSHRKAQAGTINYIRNSVKATVDAYTGEVHLYAWDESDPILKTWRAVYPGLVEPRSAIGGDLMSHLRYPEDLFKAQRELLTRYHVTDGGDFYTGEDVWRIPSDPTSQSRTGETGLDQPPYYLSVAMPGEKAPSFSLTTAYTPQGEQGNQKAPLVAFLAVESDPGSSPGTPAENYGKLRLQTIGRSSPLPGPVQVFNDNRGLAAGSQDPALSRAGSLGTWITTNSQGDSRVIYGNLLTLPYAGGYLYVQPIFTQGGSNGYPVLKVVVASFGSKAAWASTPQLALEELFGADGSAPAPPSGAPAPAPAPGPTPGATPSPAPSTPAGSATGSKADQIKAAVNEGRVAYEAADRALKAGDLAAYQREQAKARAAFDKLAQLTGATP